MFSACLFYDIISSVLLLLLCHLPIPPIYVALGIHVYLLTIIEHLRDTFVFHFLGSTCIISIKHLHNQTTGCGVGVGVVSLSVEVEFFWLSGFNFRKRNLVLALSRREGSSFNFVFGSF